MIVQHLVNYQSLTAGNTHPIESSKDNSFLNLLQSVERSLLSLQFRIVRILLNIRILILKEVYANTMEKFSMFN